MRRLFPRRVSSSSLSVFSSLSSIATTSSRSDDVACVEGDDADDDNDEDKDEDEDAVAARRC